jgi:hypothetical protein
MCTIFRELALVHSSRDNSWKIAADRIEHRNLYPYYANHETTVVEPSPEMSFVTKYISYSRQRVTKERRTFSLPGTRFRRLHKQEVASAVSFAPVPPGGRNEISNICYFPSPTFVLRTKETASDFVWSGTRTSPVGCEGRLSFSQSVRYTVLQFMMCVWLWDWFINSYSLSSSLDGLGPLVSSH